ncbi:predicted protein [Lichtheimia corymbifera JMRC:FSU:9682]|uniref:Uncharacterized protein n=1 Tax=Lichtheimia corymbifera JMRC:FSU:9682 TaxID=1263082 RepID=A0A068SAI9_9FUNG|nr:predicted protein [Lichtheimia corymbifera JMRC:FSU:9682]
MASTYTTPRLQVFTEGNFSHLVHMQWRTKWVILSPISHWNAFFYLGDASHFGKGWHNPLLVVQMKATMQYRFHLVIFWLADGISIPMQCRRLICKTQEGIP